MNDIPMSVRKELEALGVVICEEKPKQIVREYKFRMPNLDDNGEPDF